MKHYFSFLDGQINDLLRVDVGFTMLPSTRIYSIQADVFEGYRTRYELIREFQKITESLFAASLAGEADPFIATLIVNELPEHLGQARHQEFHAQAAKLHLPLAPTFFRTDEVVPGKITEIQCPGSAWCVCEQLYSFYQHFGADFDGRLLFPRSAAEQFALELRGHLAKEPLVHHLLDNASIQAGMRFFLQRTRDHGLKYYGYDKGVTAYDCNFIRAHDFVSLMIDNFHQYRLSAWKDGRLGYDLPPTIVFDEKIPLVLPFWEKTRAFYSEAIRTIFPYTSLVTPEGVTLEDGRVMHLDQFFRLPKGERQYFLKYAGSDISCNWGSKGVYSAVTMTRGQAEQMRSLILDGFGRRKYWILQKAYERKDRISYVDRTGVVREVSATGKFSGFYGPSGLLAILNMHRPFFKVHGTNQTIVSLS